MTANNENTSKCKDYMGHTLRVGDWVDVLPPQNMKWIGKIVEQTDGGLTLSLDKNNRGVTPAKIRIVFDITLQANPQLAIFPTLTKTLPPGSDEVVERIMEELDKTPPSNDPIKM